MYDYDDEQDEQMYNQMQQNKFDNIYNSNGKIINDYIEYTDIK